MALSTVRLPQFHLDIDPSPVMNATVLRNALRIALKDPAYLAVRTAGLAVGVATACIALAFVRWELGFERDAPHADRLFRIVSTASSEMPAAVTVALQGNPHVRETVRLSGIYYPLMSHGERRRFPLVRCVEPRLLSLLGLRFLEGDREAALATPHSVVITDEMKRFFFGDEPAMGKRLVWDNGDDVVVTGVVETPRHSHLVFDLLAAWDLDIVNRASRWRDDDFERPAATYVLLDDPEVADAVAAQVEAFIRQRIPDWEGTALQAVTDIHLSVPLQRDLYQPGDPWAVTGAVALAVIVVLLAAINFVNITVAQFAARHREIGVRKSLGASRRGLFALFMTEAVLVAIGATLLGLAIVAVGVRSAPDLAPMARSQAGLALSGTWGWMILVGLASGLGAGVYPAWIAARWPVVTALRGARATRPRRIEVRDLLLMLQLGLCVATLTAGATVYVQADRMRSTSMGYRTEDVLISPLKYPQVEEKYETLRQVLPESPYVIDALAIEHMPAQPFRYESFWHLGAVDRPDQDVPALVLPAIPGYLELFGHRLIAGRSFESDRDGETANVAILNETAVRELGQTPEGIIGTTLRTEDSWRVEVVGVVEDFHFEPVQKPVRPIAMVPKWADHFLAIRLSEAPTARVLDAVQKQWATVLPDFPLNYTVLADDVHRSLEGERTMTDLLVTCSVVILAIALVGVFAMTSFASRRRAKEVAVRRVLGATVGQGLRVIIAPYVRLVGIAVLVGVPPAVLLSLRWLETYPERVPGLFVAAAALLATGVTLAGTAAASAWQAASWARQPVTETLRLE